MRHLLRHTAGFGYDISNPDLLRYEENKGIPGIISCENLALTMPLTFDPGGKAVDVVRGQTLGAYFEANLFEPLGMKDTTFKLADRHRARLVGMHARQADGKPQPMPSEIPQEPEFQMGGGGLYGTAGDYLAFERMFLNGGSANGRQVLKPKTVRAMSENQMGGLSIRLLKTAIPPYSNDAEFFPAWSRNGGRGS